MQKVKIYDSGLRLVVCEKPQFESVSIVVSVNTGSINETEKNNGISHYIEHMSFKGTKTRSAQDIAAELDNISANANAFTSENTTAYFTQSLSENAEKCLEILSDLYFNSEFPSDELIREREVILEEIARYEDIPEAVNEEQLIKIFFEGHPAARTVIGTKESLMGITRDDILAYKKERYTPQNTIISFAGKIKFKDAERFTDKFFANNFKGKNSLPVINKKQMFVPTSVFASKIKKIEQAHIDIGFPSVNVYSKDLYAFSVLNRIIGGGMNSRLFQEIREKRGLVYEISSSNSSEEYGGLFDIKFATRPQNSKIAVAEIKNLINNIAKNGVTKKEFDAAKYNLISIFKLKLEKTIGIAINMADELVTYGKINSPKTEIKKIQNVTIDDVNRVARKILSQKNICISFVGPKSVGNLLKLIV